VTYPSFVGGTAKTMLSNDPSTTTVPYPPGISANDQVIVQASWADRTYWSPPPERLVSADPHGFQYDLSGNYQSTRSLPGTTHLGSSLPMAYRPADDNPALLGHFITFRTWALRNCGSLQLWVGGNVITNGVQDSIRMSVVTGGGTATTDTAVIFGVAVHPLTRYVDLTPTYAPTPLRPTIELSSWSPSLVDVVSLNEIGASEPLSHAAWLGGIPAGESLVIAYDLQMSGCAGQIVDFPLFTYLLGYALDPLAPPVGECPPRQAATADATTLRVRANA
jgi:hypothetical protein